MAVKEEVSLPKQGICVRCKFVSSQEVCKACVLLEGLNKGLPRLGVGKSSKAKKMLAEYNMKQEKASLDKAIEDLNDSTNEVISNKLSKSKSSKTGKGNNNEIVNKEVKCSNKKCCSGKCKSNQSNDDEKSKTKINSLLEEYGLNDTSNDHKTENGNGDISVISDDDDGEVLFNEQEEENSCAGACGEMGSLQIGF